MNDGERVLFLVALAGILGGNDLVAIAAGGMLVLRLASLPASFALLEQFAIPLGVIFLTVGLLLPFATGKLGLASVSQTLLSTAGFVSVLVGIASAYLGADGVKLLMVQPEVMVGLVVGSILGVSLIGGIPVGPLVAAGLTAVLFRMLRI